MISLFSPRVITTLPSGLDAQNVYAVGPRGEARVLHAESAVRNLERAGANAVEALWPDNAIRITAKSLADEPGTILFAPFIFAFGLLLDLLELILLPFSTMKDLGDAAVHAVSSNPPQRADEDRMSRDDGVQLFRLPMTTTTLRALDPPKEPWPM